MSNLYSVYPIFHDIAKLILLVLKIKTIIDESENLVKHNTVRPNIKISMFRVTGLKILGRVGTQFFFNYFFSGKKYNFMHFEFCLSKCIKTFFFPENLKKI